jgi:hypothetical protein
VLAADVEPEPVLLAKSISVAKGTGSGPCMYLFCAVMRFELWPTHRLGLFDCSG